MKLYVCGGLEIFKKFCKIYFFSKNQKKSINFKTVSKMKIRYIKLQLFFILKPDLYMFIINKNRKIYNKTIEIIQSK